MNNITIEDLVKNIAKYDIGALEMVKKAYDYADNMHFGQMRQSGDKYITHPLNVAYILSEMNADRDTICAALLHDTLEDTTATKEDITNLFNSEVAKLVDGVTKISKMNFSSKAEQNLANTRKIITGITTDVRIIIIKLADRLHNMRTIQYKTVFKQKENAIENMEIFIPLAYYIGAYRIKSELEDISFKCLKPDLYKKIEDEMYVKKMENKNCLNEVLGTISDILESELIPHEIKIRTKNIYGIYKRKLEGYDLSNIHDLLSLKIMVDNVINCYITLCLIHSRYHPINEKFKDYISNPKTNLYRSLHTTVFGPKDKLVQAQIRTFEMDKVASFGIPSYWDIVKGNARDVMQRELHKHSQVFNSLTDIDSMFENNQDFVAQIKEELFSDKIYVYNSKGEIIELPKGSNIIDYACYTGIDSALVGAKVNNQDVGFNYILKNKDRIITYVDECSFKFNNKWKRIANTNYAKKKIETFKRNF